MLGFVGGEFGEVVIWAGEEGAGFRVCEAEGGDGGGDQVVADCVSLIFIRGRRGGEGGST